MKRATPSGPVTVAGMRHGPDRARRRAPGPSSSQSEPHGLIHSGASATRAPAIGRPSRSTFTRIEPPRRRRAGQIQRDRPAIGPRQSGRRPGSAADPPRERSTVGVSCDPARAPLHLVAAPAVSGRFACPFNRAMPASVLTPTKTRAPAIPWPCSSRTVPSNQTTSLPRQAGARSRSKTGPTPVLPARAACGGSRRPRPSGRAPTRTNTACPACCPSRRGRNQ